MINLELKRKNESIIIIILGMIKMNHMKNPIMISMKDRENQRFRSLP